MPPPALSPVEAVVLHVLHLACQRVTLRTVALFVLLLGAFVALVRFWSATDARETSTLYDPDRLRAVLHRFAEGASAASPTTPPPRQRTETQCRSLLEWMLRTDLPKTRPEWLVNPSTKRRLELDMYNAERRLAFEYDGAQHDVYTPHWHRGSEHHFAYRRLLDRLKADLCAQRGVKLLRIPWREVSASHPRRTARFLERLLRENGVPFRSALAAAAAPRTDGGPLDPSRSARRCPSPQFPGAEA